MFLTTLQVYKLNLLTKDVPDAEGIIVSKRSLATLCSNSASTRWKIPVSKVNTFLNHFAIFSFSKST